MKRFISFSINKVISGVLLISLSGAGMANDYGTHSYVHANQSRYHHNAHHNTHHNGHHNGRHKKQTRHRGHHDRHSEYVYGKVLRVKPIYETRISTHPSQTCWNEPVSYRRSESATGTILGGIIGAAVGHELGHKKRNKQVGAVAGAVLGSSIGHDISRRQGKEVHTTEQKCRTVYDETREEVVVGYRVKYRFNDRVYRTRLDYDPGDYIKLRQNITPVR